MISDGRPRKFTGRNITEIADGLYIDTTPSGMRPDPADLARSRERLHYTHPMNQDVSEP